MKRTIKLVVGLVILSVLVYVAGPRRVVEGISRLGPVTFFLGCLLYFLGQWVCSVKWWIISRYLGVERPLSLHLVLYLSGMFLNLFLPTAVGGDMGRAYLLTGKERWQVGLASVIVERYAGFVVLSLILAIGVVIDGSFLPREGRFFLAMFFPLAVALPVVYARLGMRLKKKFLGEKMEVFDRVGEVRENGKVIVQSLLLSALFYILYLGLHLLVVKKLGADVEEWALVVTVTATSLVSMIPVSLGGLGLREGGYLFFLTLLGVPPHTGVAFGISILAVNLFLSLTGGVLLSLYKVWGKV